jgi:hypothetical protein
MNSTSFSEEIAAISSVDANPWITARLVAPDMVEKGFLSSRDYWLYLK